MTAMARFRPSVRPTMRWPRRRGISSSAAITSAASIGVTRYACPDTRRAARSRAYAEWQKLGVARADGQPFPRPNDKAKPWVPVPGGPAFLIGPNFFAAKSYNPSMTYALALVHLGDRCVGGEPFVQAFPGGERAPTLAELQEIQQRLTALGFDTGGADGRIGSGTTIAVRNYQRKLGVEPADGYAGITLLARLRQGS